MLENLTRQLGQNQYVYAPLFLPDITLDVCLFPFTYCSKRRRLKKEDHVFILFSISLSPVPSV